ncbi:MAG: YihY family inner membrane protein [Alphaproteobacteria bacterium]|nr:YihY family inner membrane protein [Alphaproteobacteria bacterium]
MNRGQEQPRAGLSGWRRLRAAAAGFDSHHQFITAGHLSFVGIFTLFPFLIVLVTLAAAAGSTEAARQALDAAFEQMPADVTAALRPVAYEIVNAPRRGALTLGLVTALWAASSGFEALRYGFDRAYGVVAGRQAWLTRLQSLALTLLFAAVVIVATLSVVVVPLAVRALAGLVDVPQWQETASALVSRGVGVALLVIALTSVYAVLPRARVGWLDALPGAALAVVLWFALAQAFGYYLREFASLSVTYGSLGGVVAALVFFYLTACVVLFGCEFNAAARRRAAHARP